MDIYLIVLVPADSIAHMFDVGKEFKILPKRLYWDLKDSSNLIALSTYTLFLI